MAEARRGLLDGSLTPRVKICGLTRREDAQHATGAGADYLGVVLVPGTPRAVEVSQGKEILRELPSRTVAVMANPALEEAVAWGEELGPDVIQLHGEESPEFVQELRAAGPWRIWKALRVRNLHDVREGLDAYGQGVEGILLDGWHPTQKGGSGTSFSWKEVGAIRSEFPENLHLIAAGGLRPENVEEAIQRLAPHVVDVSSGVELCPRIKDPEKVSAFIRNVGRTPREKV